MDDHLLWVFYYGDNIQVKLGHYRLLHHDPKIKLNKLILILLLSR